MIFVVFIYFCPFYDPKLMHRGSLHEQSLDLKHLQGFFVTGYETGLILILLPLYDLQQPMRE